VVSLTEPHTDSTVTALNARQSAMTERLPFFAVLTSLVAFAGFILSVYIQARGDTDLIAELRVFTPRGFSIGAAIALMLGLFSRFIIWLFVVWSVTFVPYLSLRAHRAARATAKTLPAKPLRWLQLYAATFLPVALFATAWNSLPPGDHPPLSLKVASFSEMILLILGSAAVVGSATLINRLIPLKLSAVRLSLFSLMLYTALFLAYGLGVGLVSHMAVFGILIYIMFGSAHLAELARRISMHDLDPQLAERFHSFIQRYDELRGAHEGTELRRREQLRRREHGLTLEQQRLELEFARSERDVTLGQHLSQIKQKEVELSTSINQAQLSYLERKIETLKKMFEILSKEHHNKMSEEIPLLLEEMSAKVREYSADQIAEKLNEVISKVNTTLRGIPDTLSELRTQLRETADELHRETRMLRDRSEEADGDDKGEG
jgi:hypothetical protein